MPVIVYSIILFFFSLSLWVCFDVGYFWFTSVCILVTVYPLFFWWALIPMMNVYYYQNGIFNFQCIFIVLIAIISTFTIFMWTIWSRKKNTHSHSHIYRCDNWIRFTISLFCQSIENVVVLLVWQKYNNNDIMANRIDRYEYDWVWLLYWKNIWCTQ